MSYRDNNNEQSRYVTAIITNDVLTFIGPILAFFSVFKRQITLHEYQNTNWTLLSMICRDSCCDYVV